MCTAITYRTKDFYFGRTLDYDFSYAEEVTVTPRKFPLIFRNGKTITDHFAIIGMAYVNNNYPLYYDAMNEKGLCIAGLNFAGNAHFFGFRNNKDNIAVFEFIPWLLCQCESVCDAKKLIKNINLTNEPFCKNLPAAQLHWMIADKNEAITVESTKEGIRIFDNPVGVLTNNPPFNEQIFNLNNFMHISASEPKNNFSKKLNFNIYSRGMGALGLPGDWSSQSRFVRAAFVKMNSLSEETETESVGQFFHIMDTVQQARGCCKTGENDYEITIYTSCMNADKGLYYYTTYNNRQITAVDMHKENLDGKRLYRYPLITKEQIKYQN